MTIIIVIITIITVCAKILRYIAVENREFPTHVGFSVLKPRKKQLRKRKLRKGGRRKKLNQRWCGLYGLQ